MSTSIPRTSRTGRDELVSFIENEYPKVVAAVVVMTGDDTGAEDSVQEALAALWQRSDGFRPDNVAAWVTVVAANRSRSAMRRRGAETRAIGKLGVDQAPQDDPTARLGDSELVAEALGALPERQRQIAVLFYLGDHSVRDIASALDVSEGTVKTQLSRARAALRTSLERGDDK